MEAFYFFVLPFMILFVVFVIKTIAEDWPNRPFSKADKAIEKYRDAHREYTKIIEVCKEEPLKNPTYKQMMKRIKDFKIDQIKHIKE